MRHPAEHFLKFILVKNPGFSNELVLKTSRSWGFLDPLEPTYIDDLKAELKPPPGFDPANALHRPSMGFLRDHRIYELFFPNEATSEAWEILSDPQKRLAVEQLLMAKVPLQVGVMKLNQRGNWKLTVDGVQTFGHFFWNVKLLTFDEWGKFLEGRSAMYERHMVLLDADPRLAFHHLRIEQTLDSKKIVERAQEIVYFTLEEVAAKPGASPDKVKSIASLAKSIVDLHEARSTSDMALHDVLKQFEKFRMSHPQSTPPSIHEIAEKGNYSGSGSPLALPTPEKDKAH